MGGRKVRSASLSRAAGPGSVVAKLLYRGPSSALEASIAAVMYQAAAFAVYGTHVARGGFILDDWSIAADYRHFSQNDGFLGALRHLLGAGTNGPTAQGRPVGALYHALTHAAFGSNMTLFLAWAVVLTGVVSALFYVVLRRFRMERLHAFVIGLLLLLLPAPDSTRLWVTGAVALSTIAVYLLGLLLALSAFERSGRKGLLLHAASLLVYALSVLQYEIAAPLIFLSVLAYRLRVSTKAAVYRFGADAVVVAICLSYVGSQIPRKLQGFQILRNRAGVIRHEALTLVERVGIQNGSTRLPLAVVALVLLGGAVAVWRGNESLRREVGRWLLVAVLGGIAFGAGYAMFIAADPFYTPLNPGFANRTNAAASLGLVLFLYSLVLLAALLLFRVAFHALGAIRGTTHAGLAEPLAIVAALGVASLTGIAWLSQVRHDARGYDRSFAIEDQALDVLRERVPKPAPGTTIYLFGQPSEGARNVFTFTARYDLAGAVQLLWDDPTLRGIPAVSVARHFPGNTASNWGLRCGPTGLQPRGFFYKRRYTSPYGRIIFVDVPEQRVEPIAGRSQCIAAVTRRLSLLEAQM